MRKWAIFVLVPLLLFPIAPFDQPDFAETSEFNPAYRSTSQPGPFVLDSFEALNASDDSVVMSLDERNGKLAGCAQFSGTLNGLNQPGGTGATSNGGDDVVLFGWSTASGYWSTVFGGTGTDVCNRVKWMDNSQVGLAGSFEQDINLGGDSHSSSGGKDAYFGVYNTTAQQWVGSLSVGTTAPDDFWSFTPLSNGSVALVGTTRGNLSSSMPSLSAPDCTPTPGNSTVCTFITLVDASLQPTGITDLKSTGNVVARDIVEIGTSGKTLITGYFSKDLQWDNTSVSSEGGNDLFLVRLDASLEKKYLTTLGGNGSDWGLSLVAIPSGFAVAGLTESTPTTTVQTRFGSSTPWIAPVGHGGIDGMLLKTTTNGLIVDGFLLGTPQVDMLVDVDIDGRNNLHAVGFIGSEFQVPGGGPTIGVQDKRSAFYGIVNITGGNNSHLIDGYASAGGGSSNGRANAIAVSSSDDVWIGGRLAPTASGNTFFGQASTGGLAESGYLLRIGSDADGDQRALRIDNCPVNHNPAQLDYDLDADGDACDTDDDNDGLPDLTDLQCPLSTPLGFVSTPITDHDGDGCADNGEDSDDDNDGFSDSKESTTACSRGYVNWTAGDTALDRDQDGCHDAEEDLDDDGDGLDDQGEDRCGTTTSTVYEASTWMDLDGDGCHDEFEDVDLDNDGIVNGADGCDESPLGWMSDPASDYDGDGCKDDVEDGDIDADGVDDPIDACKPPEMMSIIGTSSITLWVDYDGDGCHDLEDDDIDGDGVVNENDTCERGLSGWQSTAQTDRDGDGCFDNSEDEDDDNDGKSDVDDACDADSGFPTSEMHWSSNTDTDHDDDGCRDDSPEDNNDDNDRQNDAQDTCPRSNLLLSRTDKDDDGCFDGEDDDIDGDGLINVADSCPTGTLFLQSDVDDDGCDDLSEDDDDDNDGVLDANDECDPNDPGPFMTEWLPSLLPNAPFSPSEDIDGDGCADDSVEDKDDDNDGVLDDLDQCDPDSSDAPYVLGWSSIPSSDHDSDGCRDSDEDLDDDGDGVLDSLDACDPDSGDSDSKLGWTSTLNNDQNENGCHDIDEDKDMRAQLEEQERKTTMLVVGVGVGLVGIVIVAVIVAGRTKGQEINITGSSIEGPLKIVGGQANNLVDQSQQNLSSGLSSDVDDAE
jgi:hypothetical protein